MSRRRERSILPLFDMRLIEAVKKRPCIYNSMLPDYRNRLNKENAWKSVASEVDIPIDQCQVRWKSLRDRYLKEIKPPKTDADPNNGWELLSSLEFLRPHVTTRWRRRCPQDTAVMVEDSRQSCFPFVDIKEDRTSPEPSPHAETTLQQWPEMLEACDDNMPNSERRKRRRLESTETCQTVVDPAPEKRSPNASFLEVADDYLLRLPEKTQALVKIKILNIIFEEYTKTLE